MDVTYIGWADLVLVPIYIILLYLLIWYIKKRNPDNFLIQKYLVKGFIFKLFCAIFYGLLIRYYYGFGDSLTYFKDAMHIKQFMVAGTESWDILLWDFKQVKLAYPNNLAGSEGGWLVQRLNIILSYIAFNRFFVVTILYATLAYAGMFKMLQTFDAIMPGWHKRTALIVLFVPSVCVYGSGILKDTVCVSAMGWLIYAVYQLLIHKKFRLRYIIILAVSALVLSVVKVYIIAAFILPFVIYLIMLGLKKIRSAFFRKVLFPVFMASLVFTYISFSEKIDTMLGTYAIEKLMDTMKEQQQSYQNLGEGESGSTFDIGTMEPTVSGFLKKMPVGITATLYRPFIWETKKIVMLFSTLESLLIIWFTLFVMFKTGIFRFFRIIFNEPFVFLCIFYSLIFATLVGLSTPNFGTLARYRIPVIPFYLAGLLAILYKQHMAKKKMQHENIALSLPHQNPSPAPEL